MTVADAPRGNEAVGSSRGGEVAAGQLLTVHSCSRLGLRANPPTFSLAAWLRPGRRYSSG